MKKIIRKYPPGSNWLYVRIYGGPQSLEKWLGGVFYDLLTKWKASGRVKSFHYIHYLDPDYHLRLRFLLAEPDFAGKILVQMQTGFADLLEEDLVWKIETATYEPEYERYGFDRMQAVESLFEIDSFFWLDALRQSLEQGGTEIYQIALVAADRFLSDFGASLEDKVLLTGRMRDSAAALFGMNKRMNLQLDEKYRNSSASLLTLLESPPEYVSESLNRRTDAMAPCRELITATYAGKRQMLESDLLPDLIHMSLIRAFRTRHRAQELVIDDFLNRYYESLKVRSDKAFQQKG